VPAPLLLLLLLDPPPLVLLLLLLLLLLDPPPLVLLLLLLLLLALASPPSDPPPLSEPHAAAPRATPNVATAKTRPICFEFIEPPRGREPTRPDEHGARLHLVPDAELASNNCNRIRKWEVYFSSRLHESAPPRSRRT
jgi:hypothetical protein